MKKLSRWFHAVQWVNVGVLALNVANTVTGIFPDAQAPKWLLIAQAALGAALPSVGGVAHKAAYGESQDPEARK